MVQQQDNGFLLERRGRKVAPHFRQLSDGISNFLREVDFRCVWYIRLAHIVAPKLAQQQGEYHPTPLRLNMEGYAEGTC